QQIYQYLAEKKIDYAVDVTNQLPIYQRNIIRQKLDNFTQGEKKTLEKEIQEKNGELKKVKNLVEKAAKKLIISPSILQLSGEIEYPQEDGDKIGIYDLTEKEVDKIDWSKGAEFARSGENNKQYRLYGEGKSFFKRLIGKPTIYQIYSTLDPHEIRGKDIEFDGFVNKKNVKIFATKDFTKHDFFGEESFSAGGAGVPRTRFKDVGGVLLVGPPGNGKTLLAKALAGECRMPFLFRSGSEFEEAVVGMGARRVRELFRQARSYPQGCIVFIDEIDSIGRKRYSANPGHSEQTLNQLLNELDGFHPRDNIIILAATNSLKVLDSALLRPGRFDRQIYIPPPNLKGRREIIKLHARKLSLKSDIDLEEIAAMTKGLSGAQIANMFNEASILSIRYGKKFIDYEMIFEAYDRVLMGPSLTSQTLNPAKRRIVAYHEAGHAVIGMSLPETIVKKITIIPRWSAGGYTWVDLHGEKDDDYLLNKSQMLAHVMSSLGGRASEELIFGLEYITMGAYSDFKKASEIVRDLILHYGMSDLGIVPTQESFLYGEGVSPELPETAKQKIENEREKIMNRLIAIVAAIIHTYGYSLIFQAQATPGGLEIITSHFSSRKEDDSKMKKSLLEKEIEEQKEKLEEKDMRRANDLEKEEDKEIEKIFEIRGKNCSLTTLLKNKIGHQQLENYPQEVDYYLAKKEEKKEKLETEKGQIDKEISSASGEKLAKKLRRKNDLETRIQELNKEQKRSIFPKYLSYITNNERL
ncbi:4113_t:CDS:2, partial [Ambispora gerdemannii]